MINSISFHILRDNPKYPIYEEWMKSLVNELKNSGDNRKIWIDWWDSGFVEPDLRSSRQIVFTYKDVDDNKKFIEEKLKDLYEKLKLDYLYQEYTQYDGSSEPL